MKLLKKYGIYVLLTALAITLIMFGSRNAETPDDSGTTYVPEPVVGLARDKPMTINIPVLPEKEEAPVKEKTPVTETESVAVAVQVPPAPKKESVAFDMPVKGEIIEHYSGGKMVFSNTTNDFRTHDGVDIAAPEGTDVTAAAYGTVKEVSDDRFWGITVTVDHGNGLESRYCGLSECFVAVGNPVDCGIVIGSVGTGTGIEAHKDAHLHFEALVNGEAVDPETLFY